MPCVSVYFTGFPQVSVTPCFQAFLSLYHRKAWPRISLTSRRAVYIVSTRRIRFGGYDA